MKLKGHCKKKANNETVENRLEKMSDYDKQRLITGIENGWISPSTDNLHIYYQLKGIDEHPIITWLKKLFCLEREAHQ